MGRFIAVADVWRSWHALLWRNMRFYYNPITALLEPIGYDAVIPSHRSPLLPPELSPIIWEMLHKDSKIRGEYNLVFADPPYKVEGIVEQLVRSDRLARLLLPGGILVIETAKSDVDFPCHDGINLLTVRKYGDSQLILYRRDNNITDNDI